MSLIKSFIRKIMGAGLALQLLLAIAAFGLIALNSHNFVNDAELRRMDQTVYGDLRRVQAHIESDLGRVSSMTAGFSLSVQNMLARGDSLPEIMRLVEEISHYMQHSDAPGFLRTFLYFDGHDVIMIPSSDIVSDTVDVTALPWYTAAVAAEGDIVFTDPYTSALTGEFILACVRRMFDDEGRPLGIIGMHISLDPLRRRIENVSEIPEAYGSLFDGRANIIVHPKQELVGSHMSVLNLGETFVEEIRQRKERIMRRELINHNGDAVLISLKKIPEYGWYTGLAIPKSVYLKESRGTFWHFFMLDAVVIAVLCFILMRMSRTKRSADEFTKLVFDSIPLACDLWDDKGSIIRCNEASARLCGARDSREYLDNFYKYSPKYQPDGNLSTEIGAQYQARALAEGRIRFDWMHMTADGELIPGDITLVRVKYMGAPALLAYNRDKREELALLEKMRENERRLMTILDTTPLGVTIWDRDVNLVDFNYECMRVVGIYDKKEYVDRFSETTPEFQRGGVPSGEVLRKHINEAFETGSCHLEWMHYHVNGPMIDGAVVFDAVGFRVKFGDDDAVILYCRDMTQHNAMMKKLREADELREILFNASPLSCTLYDENINAVECNDETVRLFGAQNKAEYLRDYRKYIPETQPDGSDSKCRIEEDIRKAMRHGYNRFEWTHKHANGELIPCEITLVRVRYNGKDCLAGYVRDLREFKAMVREAHRAEIAEESSRTKSRFLASMSHEIRTPMNVILGVTDIQLQDDTLPPHMREAFTQIYNSSDLLLGIINDILDLSKIEANKMEFTPSNYSLASLINDTAHLNMMRNSKPIEFELDVSENVPTQLFGDELRIKQVLNNLLSNAFKFTEEGRVKLSVDVEKNADSSELTLVIAVSDTGQGMSREQLNRLFTEFTRFNLETNRYVEGTGLGMNITRRLVNMMGGDITVDSDVGKGTTVTVRLPQKQVSGELIGKELAENLRKFRVDTTINLRRTQITRDYMPYGRVLIVDDVESNLYVARGLMSSYGLSIDTVTSGQKAIDRIKAGKKYDVIFMDHMMPLMDGIEATRHIREDGCEIPIVALTANAVVGQADMFMKNGFDEFISKPIDIRQLNAILNRFVRDKQSPDVLARAKLAKERLAKDAPALDRAAVDPELLSIFARDAAKSLAALETAAADAEAMSDADLNLFTINTHAMKSALANIGEARLSQVAHTLEKSAIANDRKTIALQTPSFIKALRGLISKAEAECNLKECAAVDESPEFLREQLLVITRACLDYDERAVDDALDALKKMSWTSETEDLLTKISELLLHSHFEEAGELAARAANRIRQ